MVLTFGDITKNRNLPWYMLELSSDKTVQSVIRRIGKAVPSLFDGETLEIFIPIGKRDLDVFELRTGNYVFVRSTSFKQLLRLRTITGVLGLVTIGDCNFPNKAVPVEDAYVQTLINEAKLEFDNRPVGIVVGSFVRIVDGDTRDYCGTVESMVDGRAVVKIEMKDRCVMVETPVRNLVNLSHVQADRRVYYYGPMVEDLISIEGSADLVSEDLHFTEHHMVAEIVEPVQREAHGHTHLKTITAIVKRLIFEGVHQPKPIVDTVMKAIEDGQIRPPKNLFIIHTLVKSLLLKFYFIPQDPDLNTYRKVIAKFGGDYKFSVEDIARWHPTTSIPLTSRSGDE